MCTRNRHTRIISELLTWHDNKFCQLIPPYATQIPGIPRYYRQPETLHCLGTKLLVTYNYPILHAIVLLQMFGFRWGVSFQCLIKSERFSNDVTSDTWQDLHKEQDNNMRRNIIPHRTHTRSVHCSRAVVTHYQCTLQLTVYLLGLHYSSQQHVMYVYS